jgi:hypothetical protein
VSKATSCVKRAAGDGIAAMVVAECAPSFPGSPGLDATPTSEASRPWSSIPMSPNPLATTTSDHGWQMVGNISTSALVTPAKPTASLPTLRVSWVRLGPLAAASSDIFLWLGFSLMIPIYLHTVTQPPLRSPCPPTMAQLQLLPSNLRSMPVYANSRSACQFQFMHVDIFFTIRLGPLAVCSWAYDRPSGGQPGSGSLVVPLTLALCFLTPVGSFWLVFLPPLPF